MDDFELDAALTALAVMRALHRGDKRDATRVLVTLDPVEHFSIVAALAGMTLSYIGTEAAVLGITVDEYLDRLPALLEGNAR